MGVVIKQSFWGSALAYLGVFLGFFNTIILRPSYLDMEQIGLLNVVISNALLFAPFATLGMPATYVRYFPYFREDQKLDRQFFTFQIFLILIACIVIGLLALIGIDWIKEYYSGDSSIYHQYIITTFLIFVFHTLFLQISSYSRIKLDIIIPSALKEVQVRLGNMVLIFLYATEWISFEWSVKLLIVNYLIAFLINLIQVIIRYDFRLASDFFQLPKTWLQRMYHFGRYNLILAGSVSVYNNVSFLMLPAIIGLDANGIYSICYYIGIIIEMPRRSMLQVMSPILSSLFQKEDMKGVEALYKKASITLTVIACLFFLGIVCNLNDLFSLIPKGNELSTGFSIVVIIALTKLIDQAYCFNSEILNYSKYYKYNLYFLLITALLIVTLNYTLINYFGINGAAYAFLISTLFFNLAKHYFVKAKLNMTPFIKSHIKLFVVTTLIGTTFWYAPLTSSPLINIILRSILITICFVSVVFKLNISEDINTLAKNLAKKYLKINL